MDKSSKNFLMTVGGIVVLFVLFFLVRFIYNPETALTLDEMHQRNLEGEGKEGDYIYNGFSFVYADSLWNTQVMRKGDTILDIPLHFGPKELEEVHVMGNINWELEKPEVYITFDPAEGYGFKYVALSITELSLNLAKGMEIVPVAACTKNETEACKNRPIVTCDDEDISVIYLKETEEEGEVILKGNCVEISGKDWELVKATDRFLLQWYGVMNSDG